MKIIVKVKNFLILFIIFSFPSLSFSTQTIELTDETIFPNPFLVDRIYSVKDIVQVKADKHLVGYTDDPENISLHFLVRGDGVNIPNIPGDRFRYQIWQKNHGEYTRYRVNGDTHYRGDGYFARLEIPPVDRGGAYDLLITVYGDKEKSTSIIKRLPNFFRYRQKKIDVIFIIDNSGSMHRNDPKRLRYREIYSVFKSPKFASKIDELAVISFSDKSQIVFPFGKVASFLKKEMTLSSQGNTDFSKPFLLAEKLVREYRGDRDQKAVIFLTDGVANYPYADEHLRMRNLGVPIYTVGLSADKSLKEYQPDFLRKVAQDTRGEFFEAGPDVIGEVFQRFIDLSTTSEREFFVIPLKDEYTYNELIHIDYRSSVTYQRGLDMEGYFLYSGRKYPVNIYQQIPGRITLYPPSIDSAGETVDDLVKIRVLLRWRAGVIFDETSDFKIIGDRIKVDFVYFRQVDFLNYDIRYFPIINLTEEGLFVDIILSQDKKRKFIPIKSNSENSVTLPVIFKETPFLLPPRGERSQSVMFYPQKSEKLNNLEGDRETSRVIDIVLKTSKGDFLNQIYFDYLFQLKKTASFSTDVKAPPQNRILSLLFSVLTVIFLVLLFLKMIKSLK